MIEVPPRGRTVGGGPVHIARSVREEDGPAESRTKLEALTTGLFPDAADEILPYLASMLGLPVPGDLEARVKHLDAQAMGRQILLTSRRFFERLARQEPLVLVFEDLHWVDQSSMELIEHLFPLVEKVPLLLCGVSRPGAGTPAARLREIASQRYGTRYTEAVLAPSCESPSIEQRRSRAALSTAASGGLPCAVGASGSLPALGAAKAISREWR